MSQAVSKFIGELAVHFPNRFDTEAAEDQWLKSMVRNLRGYDTPILEMAAREIIDTRTDRRFPLPADIKDVCARLVRTENMKAPPQLRVEPSQFADWRSNLADDLVKCGIGRQAADEGWILSLHDFARNNGRLPAGGDIAKCKATAIDFVKAYEECLRGEAGALSGTLARLGTSMLKRRGEIAAKVKESAA